MNGAAGESQPDRDTDAADTHSPAGAHGASAHGAWTHGASTHGAWTHGASTHGAATQRPSARDAPEVDAASTSTASTGEAALWEAAADVVVVGSGVAGLTAALRARELGLRVLVVTKAGMADGNTRWAQGGLAVVLPGEHDAGDSVAAHVADTIGAGAGLCDEYAARTILAGGPEAVRRLRELGAVFDSAGAGFDGARGGQLARTREGGHSAFRVVHAGGDATGAEVQRALGSAARTGGLPVLERHVAVDLLRTSSGAVGGLWVLDSRGVPGVLRAPAVLLATGGLGQLYRATTNPELATADGLALALRAGSAAADLEFVQFHPTVLYTPDGTGRRPLVTEAVRGEGAVLVDGSGARVLDGIHPMGDLAPRDVVSRAISERITETGQPNVYLDATGLAEFAGRFPTVHAACRQAGIDPASDPIPVAPAAHFSCGGIRTSTAGRTDLTGLYAAGEVARTGLHGANRLASNSLIEGLVVGRNAAEAVAADRAAGLLGDIRTVEPCPPAAVPVADRTVLQQVMSRYAGIGRDADGLSAADARIAGASVVRRRSGLQVAEDAALTLVARVLLVAARERAESRGCHVRRDAPGRDADLARSLGLRLDVSATPIVEPHERPGRAA